MPVKWDLSVKLSPAKRLSFSSTEEFLSEIEPLVMQPRHLIDPKWMEGIEDVTSAWSDAFETIKGATCIDLLLSLTIERVYQLWTLGQPRSKQLCTEKVKFGVQKLWRTLDLGKGNVVLLVVNLGNLDCNEYLRKSTASKKFPLMSMSSTSCWYRK